MDQNVGIVKELVEILNEAHQVIPDWLTKCGKEAAFGRGGSGRGNRGRGGRSQPRFGATDYRNDSEGGSSGGWHGGQSSNGGGGSSSKWF